MEFALGIVGALASSALPEVLSAIRDKLKGRLPAEKDLGVLKIQLGYIKAAILDHYNQLDGKKISHLREEWIENLRPLAYEIEDCIEGFLQQVMSDGKETEDTSEKFGTEIGNLKEKLEIICNELTKFPNETVDSASSGSIWRRGPPTCSAQTGHYLPVGMDKPLGELRKLVAESESESKRKLKVISIVGFGGLGKTLLANQVYSDDLSKEKREFHRRAWVRADGKGPQQLLKEIIKQAETSDSDDKAGTTSSWLIWTPFGWRAPHSGSRDVVPQFENKDKGVQTENTTYDAAITPVDRLIKSLQSCLETKRYLIVIIDMRDKKQWSAIKDAFPRTSGIDSRIIVTTTNQSVAKCCSSGDGHVYSMGALTAEDSLELFFRRRGEVPSSSVRQQSAAILEKCDGLPLAVLSTADYCAGEDINEMKVEQAFREICDDRTISISKEKEVQRDEDENEEVDTDTMERMRRVLLSSYGGLPNPCVQACLLYFCMFPRDHHVGRNSLIRRWLAEGLAQTSDAVENLETLIDRSIIQSTEVSNDGGRMKRCKIPGIVLEYITRKSKSQHFAMVLNESQQTSQQQQQQLRDARRLSLYPNAQASVQVPLRLPVELPKVRTLAVFSTSKEGKATALSNKEAINGYKLLRVLDLEGCAGLNDSDSDLQKMCCNLLLLKYLSLGGSITSVPREIKKLELLETLDLRKTQIHRIPVQVIMLPRLRNLLGILLQLDEHGIFRNRDFVQPFNDRKKISEDIKHFLSSDDSKLEMLSGFITGSSRGFPELLSYMTKLRKVKICCGSAAHKENLNALSQGIWKFLRLTDKDNGRSLSIDMADFPKELSADEFLYSLIETDPPACNGRPQMKRHFRIFYSKNEMTLPNESQLPPSLYSLKLDGQLRGFPEFVTQLNSITELCLSRTGLSPEKMLDGLNRLQNSTLKYLKLVEQELGPLEIRPEYFTSLERLCLVADKTMGEVTILDGALKHLVSLRILCGDLDGLSGIEIQSLTSLKEVGLHSGVTDATKATWEEAAMSHPNWPNLMLVDPPKSQNQEYVYVLPSS